VQVTSSSAEFFASIDLDAAATVVAKRLVLEAQRQGAAAQPRK
jgi:hypothetical protein